MTTDSVKFLNTKCLLSASITARRELMEDDERVDEVDVHLRDRLGRMLGVSIMEHKAEVTLRRDPRTGDYIRQAEVYALSPMDMRRLYDMIRDEIRAELRVPEDAKSDESDGDEITMLKDTIDGLDVQLKEAREAAVRADAAAERLYRDLRKYKDCTEKRLAKIRKQEQTIQTLENALSRKQDEAARLRRELGEARTELDRRGAEIRELTERNDNQCMLIQSLRGASGMAIPAVIEAIKALQEDGGGFCGVWSPDVENFADELISRLKGM